MKITSDHCEGAKIVSLPLATMVNTTALLAESKQFIKLNNYFNKFCLPVAIAAAGYDGWLASKRIVSDPKNASGKDYLKLGIAATTLIGGGFALAVSVAAAEPFLIGATVLSFFDLLWEEKAKGTSISDKTKNPKTKVSDDTGEVSKKKTENAKAKVRASIDALQNPFIRDPALEEKLHKAVRNIMFSYNQKEPDSEKVDQYTEELKDLYTRNRNFSPYSLIEFSQFVIDVDYNDANAIMWDVDEENSQYYDLRLAKLGLMTKNDDGKWEMDCSEDNEINCALGIMIRDSLNWEDKRDDPRVEEIWSGPEETIEE